MTKFNERYPEAVRIALLCLSAVCAIATHFFLVSTGWLDAPAGLLLAVTNTFATPDWVMRKVARRLVNNTVFAANVNRSYDGSYKQQGVKMGDTVTARLPQRYQVTVGAVMVATPLTDQTVAITITDQSNIGFEYDSWHATLEVDDYMERYGNPAVDALVNNIDYTGLARCYLNVSKSVGVPAVVPGSTGTLPQAATQTYLDAVTKLFDAAVPDPYVAMLTSDMHAYLMNATIGLFSPSGSIAANFRRGQFGNDALGIDRWFKTQNAPTHVVGALGGTPLVNGAGQTGATILGDGTGGAVTGYFKQGDVIRFAGVNEINPLSHQSVGRLKDFVVTADVDAPAAATLSIPISPSIIISGPWRTCSAAPANNAAITTFGHASSYAALSTPQGLVYNRDAFCLVMADLILPRGLWVSERISNAKLGISIRMLKDHDIINDVSPARLDTAHGWKTIRETLACRVCS